MLMTKKERTLAAFRGKEVDHVPVCMWKHVPGEYWNDFDRFAYENNRSGEFNSRAVDFFLRAEGRRAISVSAFQTDTA